MTGEQSNEHDAISDSFVYLYIQPASFKHNNVDKHGTINPALVCLSINPDLFIHNTIWMTMENR